MIEMKVRGIAVDPQLRAPAVILTDEEEKRYLPIWIGVAEATAIFIQLNGQALPRPMTHDLMKNILDAFHVKLVKVVVNDIEDRTFYALLFLQPENGEPLEIDARPSDAIALALRMGAPIFVSEKVVVDATIVDKKKVQAEMTEFKKFLQNLSPKDFENFRGNKDS